MSETHEPGSIGDKMLKIAEACIIRFHEKAERHRANGKAYKETGDRLHRAGNITAASYWHNKAIDTEDEARIEERDAEAMAEAWGIEPAELKIGTRWAPILTHSGVGEGDAGLPFAELPASNAEQIPVNLNPEPEPLGKLAASLLDGLKLLEAHYVPHACGGFTTDDMQWSKGRAFIDEDELFTALDELQDAGLIVRIDDDETNESGTCYRTKTSSPSAPAKNPRPPCEGCTETDCLVSHDGTCARIRRENLPALPVE